MPFRGHTRSPVKHAVGYGTHVYDFPIVSPVTIPLSRTVFETQRLMAENRAVFIVFRMVADRAG